MNDTFLSVSPTQVIAASKPANTAPPSPARSQASPRRPLSTSRRAEELVEISNDLEVDPRARRKVHDDTPGRKLEDHATRAQDKEDAPCEDAASIVRDQGTE